MGWQHRSTTNTSTVRPRSETSNASACWWQGPHRWWCPRESWDRWNCTSTAAATSRNAACSASGRDSTKPTAHSPAEKSWASSSSEARPKPGLHAAAPAPKTPGACSVRLCTAQVGVRRAACQPGRCPRRALLSLLSPIPAWVQNRQGSSVHTVCAGLSDGVKTNATTRVIS